MRQLTLIHHRSQTSPATVTHTFRSARSYHPSYSLLGRALRAWTGDRLRGEALFIVALTGLALTLLMTHYLGWALLKPVLVDNPSWQILFWGGQLASVAAWAAIGLLGIRPAVTVECTHTGLTVEQGSRSRTVAYDAIDAVEMVSARQYHRHYRQYAATDVFVGDHTDDMLLLHTEDGPLIIALDDADDQVALRRRIETVEVETPEPVPQPRS